jgi:hypothetical protein
MSLLSGTLRELAGFTEALRSQARAQHAADSAARERALVVPAHAPRAARRRTACWWTS